MKGEGIFDVDANTSIDQLSEDLNIKMPEVFYFIVYGFKQLTVCRRIKSYCAKIGTNIQIRC